MKILAFGASSSLQSINRVFASYVANLVKDATVELLDLNDYELPIFSQDREKQLGQPELAQKFYAKIGEADALVISFAEHNGSYSAAYKNIFDWASRINHKVFQNKPALFLATSPGKGGASSVLNQAVNSAPHFAADVKASISLPSFYENFDREKQELLNREIKERLLKAIELLKK